ncbi:unnamed protein product [Lactuca saligna]|uniref:Transmembrane protein n=1 Tax=Lactuca saligna TaxID=75948 RepID=A0AA36DUM3_LACSI|nr:unnamed protein product [Lactuca saligna]
MTSRIITILTLLFFTTSRAQDRPLHGLNQNPVMALPPSAYEFFNPIQNPCQEQESNCSPLPLAATVESSLANESRAENEKHRGKFGSAGIAAIISSFVFVVLLLAMGVYYVVTLTTRRANLSKKSTVIPSAQCT